MPQMKAQHLALQIRVPLGIFAFEREFSYKPPPRELVTQGGGTPAALQPACWHQYKLRRGPGNAAQLVHAIYCLSSLISPVILDRSSDKFPELPYCVHRHKNKIISFFCSGLSGHLSALDI